MRFAVFTLGIGLVAVTAPAFAHHSFAAEYDSNKKVQLVGVVTKVEWMNPHTRFYLDVKEANGNVVNWELELRSPNVLRVEGWSRTSMKAGDRVTVDGYLARDGSRLASAREVRFANGRRVFSGPVTGTYPPQ
jgi:hypothetical protein